MAAGLAWGAHGAAAADVQRENIGSFCGREPHQITGPYTFRKLVIDGGVGASGVGAADTIDIAPLHRPMAMETVPFMTCQLHKLPEAHVVQGSTGM